MEVGVILTVIGTGATVIGLNYQIMRNFRQDVNESLMKMEKNFEQNERKFEKMDQRLFLLCMGKDLASILKSEREEKE